MTERVARDIEVIDVFQCPECIYSCDDPERLGVHLERHREVLPSERGSVPCPGGCGRHFPHLGKGRSSEVKHHFELCRGERPLWPIPPSPADHPRFVIVA